MAVILKSLVPGIGKKGCIEEGDVDLTRDALERSQCFGRAEERAMERGKLWVKV